MARPERFELPTTWFEARCSIQLSYGRNGAKSRGIGGRGQSLDVFAKIGQSTSAARSRSRPNRAMRSKSLRAMGIY